MNIKISSFMRETKEVFNIFIKKREFTESILLVYVVSAVNFFGSIFSNLLIPSIATKTDYAEYRVIILYGNYAGFLHLGLLNGLYIYVIKKTWNDIDRSLIVYIRRILLTLQFLLIPIMGFVLYKVLSNNISINSIIVIGISWGVANLITFGNYLWQGLGNFRRYSIVNLLGGLSSLLILTIITISKDVTVKNLAFSFLIPLIITFGGYEYFWWSKFKSPREQIKKVGSQGIELLKRIGVYWQRGFVLYFANVLNSFIFSLGSLLVSLKFNPLQFANFSFAYGFASILYIGFDGLAMVLIPYLAKLKNHYEREYLSLLSNLVVVWISPAFYWVSSAIVKNFFYDYNEAIPLLFIFTISIPFSAFIRTRIISITVAIGKETLLFFVSSVGFLLMIILLAYSYITEASIISIAVGWVFAISLLALFGCIILNSFLKKQVSFTNNLLLVNSIAASILFFVIGRLSQNITSGMLFLSISVIILIIEWNYLQNRLQGQLQHFD